MRRFATRALAVALLLCAALTAFTLHPATAAPPPAPDSVAAVPADAGASVALVRLVALELDSISHRGSMPEIQTVRVQHPDVQGAVMIVNAEDFDPAVHTRIDEAASQHSHGNGPASMSAAAPGGSIAGTVLPAGYEVKHKGGKRWAALVDGKPLRSAESDEEVRFESKEAALAALQEYAAAVVAQGAQQPDTGAHGGESTGDAR